MKMRLVSGLILSMLSCAMIGQITLFSDDFNSCNLSEKWSYNLTGNQNVSWGIGFPSNPKAAGSSIDSTCMLYIDDDLTGDKTAPFKLRLYSSYFNGSNFSDIHFSAQVHFRKDKTEYLRIIIDNGKKEHIIKEFKGSNYTGNLFSNYYDMNADISFVASDSMRIIIEYDDDNQWAWWAGVDNIKVTGKEDGKIVLSETFNDCALPEGWSTEIVDGVNDWQFGIFTDGKSIDGSCFSYFNDDALGQNAPLSKIRLYSPSFNGSEFANYKMTYDLIFRIYEPSEYLQLYIDNGKVWMPVKTYNGDVGGPSVNQFVKDTIDLSPFRSEEVRLIWEYNDGGWAWWLGFDNLKVVGQRDINDRCHKAKALYTDGNCDVFNNTNALISDEFDANQSSHTGILYYEYSSQVQSSIRVNTSTIFNDNIEIYSGNCENPVLVQKANKDEYGFSGESIFFNAESGQNYILRVYGEQAEFGLDRGEGCIKIEQAIDYSNSPLSDQCLGAIAMSLNNLCYQTDNQKAKLDGPLPSVNNRSRADIWFSFTPPQAGDYTFQSNANFADVIALYSGQCSALEEIFSNYNGGKIDILNAVPNQTYFIQITGYFALLEGQVCASIFHKEENSIPNNNCLQSIPLSLNANCTSFENKGAGFSGVQPDCEVYIVDDVWFSFIASSTGQAYIRAKADFEYILSVYEGSCNSLKSIFCGQDVHHCNGYIHISHLEQGKSYFIQLGSKLIHGQHNVGAICIEIKDQDPNWHAMDLQVSQECISKGAVKFTPVATGGSGSFTYEGLGLEIPVSGNDHYFIQARDGDGCVNALEVNAISCNDFGCTLTAQSEKQEASCFDISDGQASISINGGLEPFHFIWSDGQSTPQATNLHAGNYSVTVSDNSGCELVQEFIIYQPAQLVSNPTFNMPLCFGDSTGSIDLFVIGGNGNYAYQWQDGSTNAELSNIPGGDYFVTITDGSGCTQTQYLNLLQPDKISISSTQDNNLCAGDQNGSIMTEIKGGTGAYSMLWSTGSQAVDIDSLLAGHYTLSVTDYNGCESTKIWEITEPKEISLQVNLIDLIYSSTKSATIDLSFLGGNPPFQYTWYKDGTEIGIITEDLNAQEDGTFHVVAKDSNGCFFTSEDWIISRSTFTITTQQSDFTVYPNPAKDLLHIQGLELKSVSKIFIKDMTGRTAKVFTSFTIGASIQLNVSELVEGSYILEIYTKNEKHLRSFIKGA